MWQIWKNVLVGQLAPHHDYGKSSISPYHTSEKDMSKNKRKESPETQSAAQASINDIGSKSFEALYPAWTEVSAQEAAMASLPAAGGYVSGGNGIGYGDGFNIPGIAASSGGDEVPLKRILPEQRAARYEILRIMAKDPTIDSAIKMHIANALNSKSDTVESVFIKSREPAEDKKNAIVSELNNVLMPIINKDLNEWARKAAVYGACFVRVYGEPSVGIKNVRCDYYTHPRFIQKFEKNGRLAGFTTTYQGAGSPNRQIQLLPPWTFVGFEIPEWHDIENMEPASINGMPVDLSVDDSGTAGLVESQEYGTSLIATAYGPWMDLQDAICSLRMSRRNAARLERIISVNTGTLSPERAARYMDAISERLTNASKAIQTQSYMQGNVQTVVNHIIPNFSEKGSVNIEAAQGTPDINGLEDVLFHIKRLGSAVGVDPALLGFGDLLAGGLGDGGFFRVSVMAAIKADLLRKAIKNGIQRLCELHIAYRYGKVFLPQDCPWRIGFNAVSTAIEREAQEALESRASVAGAVVGAMAVLDQEFSFAEKRELAREVWRIMQLDEESFERVFPDEQAAKTQKSQEENLE